MAELGALYASALFKLAAEGGAIDDVYAQSLFVRDVLKDADCRRILVHPHISNASKREFFGKIFEGRVRSDLFSLLLLVIDKNRETFFLPAVKALINLIERHNRIAQAHVTSASELSGQQVLELKKILSDKLDKRVDVFVKVDPSVIGGPFINVDGYYIDRTIKTKLHDMAASMKVGCGA